ELTEKGREKFEEAKEKLGPTIDTLKKRISSAIEAGIKQAKEVEEKIREKAFIEEEETKEE
ncbi:MAG: hypothetical protein KAV97_02165, partial [Actinomycetia bacterium]|nr:hypothetical protein [Actinomycetes bacterium]